MNWKLFTGPLVRSAWSNKKVQPGGSNAYLPKMEAKTPDIRRTRRESQRRENAGNETDFYVSQVWRRHDGGGGVHYCISFESEA